MRRLLALPTLAALAFLAIGAAPQERHVRADLVAVNGSGITGTVNLVSLPQGGTLITIQVRGLTPGAQYTSLYYDNHTCELEPYSADDVVGSYTGSGGGTAAVSKKVDDDLDEINSVSVRNAGDFSLLSCADVHPGG